MRKASLSKQREVFATWLSADVPHTRMDPLWIPQAYKNSRDIETAAWIASIFAFGQVKSFLPVLQKMQAKWGASPFAYIKNGTSKDFDHLTDGIYYRWYKTKDVKKLFSTIQTMIQTHGSLYNHASSIADQSHQDFEQFMSAYAQSWRSVMDPQTRGQQFMIPDPVKKSTMKRLLMFIRWMIHTRAPDFGIWSFFSPTDLWIALDTHMFQFAKQFGWTQDKTPNLQTVKSVSKVLSKIYPEDPMRLDFQLTQMGILRDCLHHHSDIHCAVCPLRRICTPITKG